MPENLSVLIARLPKVAGDGIGISSRENHLAEEIQRHGAKAIPLLLPLLKSPSRAVRNLTAYTLCDIEGLNESHLPYLIAAERIEISWLPSAIARIGTPRAVAFLAEELKQTEQAESQVGFAFEILGVKGIPALCRLIRTISPKDDCPLGVIVAIFARLDIKARRAAVEPLLALALDKRLPVNNRQYALLSLGNLGQPAAHCVASIQRLAQQDPASFRQTVESALFLMNVPDAVPGLLKQLNQKDITGFDIVLTMRDLGSLRANGVSAGPSVVGYLSHPDWTVRVAAARTVGFIGYRKAIPDLVTLLSSKEDWRLVWSAAESLGRLGATEALNDLRLITDRHWYPPVRKCARLAIDHIWKKKPYPDSDKLSYRNPFPFEFFQYEQIRASSKIPPAPKTKAGDTLTIPEGVFNATDKGEWGGDLTFEAKNGVKQVLINTNVCAVALLGKNIIAAGGLAHLSLNSGMLYQLTQNASGMWTATRWRALPGAPDWVEARTMSGVPSLRIACYGGTVEVTFDGTMHFIA